MADDRVQPQDGMAPLEDVIQAERDRRQHHQ